MSKTIRLEDEVYERLDKKLIHRETFTHLVKRLLDLHDTMSDVSNTLGPEHFLRKRPTTDARTQKAVDG